ncbi:MAG TPA: type II secretion system protein N, partial [Rheinheimera sp.]|uniref:type II secretion system protein N n=1 Tax=Rheinheimera sp. TaxID=1869214 RepID=UPI002F93D57C
MTKAKLIIIGVISYLLFTLFLTPASWWFKLVPLPAQVQLGGISGTLWQGNIAGVQYQNLQLTDVQWRMNGWQLFTGKLQFALQSGSAKNPQQPYFKGTASYGFNGAALTDGLVKLPVAQLIPMLPLPLPVQASGELVLDIPSFQQGQPRCKLLSG